MELFYAYEVSGGMCLLDAEESGHCVRVLRHRAGDEIDVIDGLGTLYHCTLLDDSPKGARAQVLSTVPEFGAHPYHLTLGWCPTKNNDRFEWFVEKATELGVDNIVPLIGERSERRVYKTERSRRIALSAAKQSLKARIPVVWEPMSIRSFVADAPQDDKGRCHPAAACQSGDTCQPETICHSERSEESLRLIAYCFEDESAPRISIREALAGFKGDAVTILIGPEGDFSPEEAQLALSQGYIPVHLGASRLRTETAAVTAVAAVYFRYLK